MALSNPFNPIRFADNEPLNRVQDRIRQAFAQWQSQFAALIAGGGGGGGNPFRGTVGSVIFIGPAGTLYEDNAGFFFDDNRRLLSVGTNTPVGDDTAQQTKLFLVGGVPRVMSAGGHLRSIIRNVSANGAGVLLFLSDENQQNDTPYAGGGAAVYFTGTEWEGNEGPNALVLMAPNPGILDDPKLIFGITGQRKVMLQHEGLAGNSILRVYNPDEVSSGGVSALRVDNNNPGVFADFSLGGTSHVDFPDTLVVGMAGGPIVFTIDSDEWMRINQGGDVDVASLAAGGNVIADPGTGRLRIGSTNGAGLVAPLSVDGEDGEDGLPGQQGATGADGRNGAAIPLWSEPEEYVEPPFVPPNAVPPPDSVSFHFYIDETGGALGWPSGVLVPSSMTAITFLPGQVGFVPATNKNYSRGDLTLNVRTNTLVGGETYTAQATSFALGALGSITVASGVTGVLQTSFSFIGAGPTDSYSILVTGDGNTRQIEYTAVLRLYEF